MKVKQFKDNLMLLCKTVFKRTTSNSLFVFTGSEVVAYGDVVCASFPFETDFECTVPVEGFTSVVKALPEDLELSIKMNQGTVEFVTERTEAGTYVVSAEEEEDLVEILKKRSKVLDETYKATKSFLTGLELCKLTVSRNPLDIPFHYICITETEVVSSDNYRVSVFEHDMGFEESFLLPSGVIADIDVSKIKNIAVDNSYIHFVLEGEVALSIKKVIADYPIDGVKDILSVEGTEIVLPSELSSAVARVSKVLEDVPVLDREVVIFLSKRNSYCKAESDKGWVKERLDIKWKNDDLLFVANPDFLLQILKKTDKMILSHDKTKALFVLVRFKHVMALPFSEDEE